MDKKDKRAVKCSKQAPLKLKRRKLKDPETLDQLTKVRRTFGSKDDEFVKVGGVTGNHCAKNSSCPKILSEISDSEEPMGANIGTKISNKSKKDGKRKRKDLHTAKERKMQEGLNKVGAEKAHQISSVDEDPSRQTKEKSKKSGKRKTKGLSTSKKMKTEENHSEVDAEEVEQLVSVDEDCSRGMRKWLTGYEESRPGLKILQQRIDDFITAYEEQQEQERKEREARVAEGGWTVVMHHRGRKKTTDTESGITVGSVAQAAVMDKMTKKKSKEVGLDFYRFQRREAKRNEVMMLQSKFEQDKKRIQQLRAARKFRPY